MPILACVLAGLTLHRWNRRHNSIDRRRIDLMLPDLEAIKRHVLLASTDELPSRTVIRTIGYLESLSAIEAASDADYHLAECDALLSLAGHRRQAAWAATASVVQGDLFDHAPVQEAALVLPAPGEGENLVADYRALGLSLRRHPLFLLRSRLAARRFLPAAELRRAGHRALVRAAGIVVGRQRPGTATGIVFVTLEDESGLTNVVVHPQLVEKQRRELLGARLLGVYGQLQVEGEVVHLVAKRLVDLSSWLGRLETVSRDFH